MSKTRNTKLIRAAAGLVFGIWLYSSPAFAQQRAVVGDQRDVLQQILSQTYQPSQVGRGMMGVGSDTGIRRAGAIVVVERPGLYASLDRNEIATSAIRGLDASLYRGNKDYEVPVGERYYVFSITVVQESVTIAMLSARAINSTKGSGRMWTALTFYFPPEALANADKDLVFRGVDAWIALEGRSQVTVVAAPQSLAAPVAAQVTPAPPAAQPPPVQPAVEQPSGPPTKLAPGMTRDEIVAAIGAPQREMSFEGRSWLTYPNMVLVLEGGKLTSIDSAAQPPAKVAVHSEPAGAEVYLDGQLIGSTPSTVELPAGTHELSVRLSGYQDWVRNLRVLSGSEINLDAKLDKK